MVTQKETQNSNEMMKQMHDIGCTIFTLSKPIDTSFWISSSDTTEPCIQWERKPKKCLGTKGTMMKGKVESNSKIRDREPDGLQDLWQLQLHYQQLAV